MNQLRKLNISDIMIWDTRGHFLLESRRCHIGSCFSILVGEIQTISLPENNHFNLQTPKPF